MLAFITSVQDPYHNRCINRSVPTISLHDYAAFRSLLNNTFLVVHRYTVEGMITELANSLPVQPVSLSSLDCVFADGNELEEARRRR